MLSWMVMTVRVRRARAGVVCAWKRGRVREFHAGCRCSARECFRSCDNPFLRNNAASTRSDKFREARPALNEHVDPTLSRSAQQRNSAQLLRQLLWTGALCGVSEKCRERDDVRWSRARREIFPDHARANATSRL